MTNFSSIWDILNIPLGFVMRICYTLVDNYFIALLLFALIMQIVLLPLAIKQQKNQVRQASLQPKIAAIRRRAPNLDIMVDGGINAETGVMAARAGANQLVAGSYLFRQADMAAAVSALRQDCAAAFLRQ